MSSLREWTTVAVDEGGTGRWVVGLFIKGFFEIVVSFMLAATTILVISVVFDIPRVTVYGLYGRQGAAVGLTLLIWKTWLLCTYTSTLD